MNAINVISPYRYLDMWVFDDPRVGLSQEPFVAGADTMIDRVVADIPNAEQGFTMIFSAAPFPSGVAAETIVTVGALFRNGVAAVGGAAPVRPAVVATAAAGRLRATEGAGAGVGAAAGAETTAIAVEDRAAGRNSKRYVS